MVLYVDGDRIKAEQISEDCGRWIIGGRSFTDLAKDSVWYESLEGCTASSSDVIAEETFVFARRLAEVLGRANLPASEADTIGRIVVFADEKSVGIPSVEDCVNALGLHRMVDEMDLVAESYVVERNWYARLTCGFCYETEEWFQEACSYGDGRNEAKILASTELMANGLKDHFEYNMTESVVCAPVLYGGRHKNSNALVAVLSMRVWT